MIYMSRGVRKRLRHAILTEQKYMVEIDDPKGAAELDQLLKIVKDQPTGRLVPDDWEEPNDSDGETDAERIAIAISYYGILEAK